jgi:5,10-methylenetetrahydromethanopterin reductase
MRPGRSGVILQAVDAPAIFENMVEEIERLGFDHLWLTDSSLHARDCYSYLALAAKCSERLLLGTAVTNPLTRHPGVTAVAITTIDEISGGRAILGIGAGDRPLLALGMNPSSMSSLEAAVGSIRSLLRGEEAIADDPVFRLRSAHLRFGARPDLPVFISASGPRTLELAGRVADGVILLVGLFPEAIEWALSHIDRGAAVSGRDRPHLAVFAYGSVNDDRDRALASARSIAAWFPKTAPHICRLAGLPEDTLLAVQRAYSGGEFQEAREAAELLPRSFVEKVALAGDEGDARKRIRSVFSAGADSIHVFPLGDDRMDTVRAFSRCCEVDVAPQRS